MTLVPTASYFRTVDDVAERLESVRTDRGWSAREFSRLAGLDEKQFQKIQERGGRRAAVDTIAAFAKAAGVKIDWLLTGEGPRDANPVMTTRYEPIERYHNRRVALEALSGEIHERTRERIQSRAYASYVDPPVSHWIEQILAEEKRVQWELAHPEEAAAEAQRRIEEMHREAEKANAKTAALIDPASGLRPLEGPPPPKQPRKKREDGK